MNGNQFHIFREVSAAIFLIFGTVSQIVVCKLRKLNLKYWIFGDLLQKTRLFLWKIAVAPSRGRE